MNCIAFRQDNLAEKGHFVKAKNALKASRPPPLRAARLPCDPPPSRGAEREVANCTTKANARAQKWGPFLTKMRCCPFGILPCSINSA